MQVVSTLQIPIDNVQLSRSHLQCLEFGDVRQYPVGCTSIIKHKGVLPGF